MRRDRIELHLTQKAEEQNNSIPFRGERITLPPSNENQSTEYADAIFLGWQKNLLGESFALYTIIAAEHPLYGSTVSEKTLRKFNLKIPPIPAH